MKESPVRNNIIQTASHLFYTNGYNLTGINEIIKEAGIAKATLYNHFKSKDDICLAYLKYKHHSLMTDIKAYIKNKPKGEKKVLGLFDFLLAFFKTDEFNGCWCIKTVSEIPKEKKEILSEIKNQKQQLIAYISQLIDDNLTVKSIEKTTQLAQQIYLIYEGAVGESHLHEDRWPIDSAKKICKTLIQD